MMGLAILGLIIIGHVFLWRVIENLRREIVRRVGVVVLTRSEVVDLQWALLVYVRRIKERDRMSERRERQIERLQALNKKLEGHRK